MRNEIKRRFALDDAGESAEVRSPRIPHFHGHLDAAPILPLTRTRRDHPPFLPLGLSRLNLRQ